MSESLGLPFGFAADDNVPSVSILFQDPKITYAKNNIFQIKAYDLVPEDADDDSLIN